MSKLQSSLLVAPLFCGLISLAKPVRSAPLVSPDVPLLQLPPQLDLVLQLGHVSEIVALKRGPQDVIASAGYYKIAVWRNEGRDLLWTRDLPRVGIVGLQVVAGDKLLVGNNDTVWAYDLWSGEIVGEINVAGAGRWQPGGAAPGAGTGVLSAVTKNTLEIVNWNAQTGALQRRSVPLSAAMTEAVAKQKIPRGGSGGLRDSGQNAGAVVAPDGKTVALWGDGTLFVAPLDLSAPRTLRVAPESAKGEFRRAVWSPDSTKIALSSYVKPATGKSESALRLVNATTLDILWSIERSTAHVVSFRPDGAQFYAEAAFDAATGQQLSYEDYGIGIWNADNSTIIRGDGGSGFLQYEANFPPLTEDKSVKTGRRFYPKMVVRARGRAYAPYAATWAPDGKRVMLQNQDKSSFSQVTLWSWPDLSPITLPESPSGESVQIARWSTDGAKLVLAREYDVASFESATGKKLTEDRSFPQYSTASDFQITPAGDAYFRYTEFDGAGQTVSLGGKFPELPANTQSVAFTPQGEVRALFYRWDKPDQGETEERPKRLWFLKVGATEIALPDESYQAIGYSSDASTLWVTALSKGESKSQLRAFDAASGRVLGSTELPKLGPNRYLNRALVSIASGAGTPRFAIAGADEVRIYDAKLEFVSLPVRGAQKAAVSPDGKFVIAAVGEFFEVWDVDAAQKRAALSILGASMSPDDKPLLQWIKFLGDKAQMSAGATDFLRWREGNALANVNADDFKTAN